jgi:hypothetical protein
MLREGKKEGRKETSPRSVWFGLKLHRFP